MKDHANTKSLEQIWCVSVSNFSGVFLYNFRIFAYTDSIFKLCDGEIRNLRKQAHDIVANIPSNSINGS